MFSLAGKKALIVGIANEDSIAFGCAKAFRAQGAELAVTFPDEKSERFVRPVAEKLAADMILPLDVRRDEQFGALTEAIGRRWERINICLHAVAFCPKADLRAPVTGCSRDGFAVAMDISVYSFIRLVRETAPVMSAGGACMTVSFLGAEKVIEHYNIMGPVKAALEAATAPHGGGARPQRHPRACFVARAAKNAGGFRHRPFRRASRGRRRARANPSPRNRR